VATTFAANGYIGTFTLGEESAAYDIGIREGTIEPYEGSLDWVTVWNRQLTAQEALLDFANPLNVQNGLRSAVSLNGSNRDQGAIGGVMTVNGTLVEVDGAPFDLQRNVFTKNLRPSIFAPGVGR
jgi:hypothetical protein